MGTHYPKESEVKRDWLLVDLEGQTVGRAASKIASLLRGKHKVIFTPHADVGDYIVCINAEKVHFTGNKLDGQMYHKASRYVGHLKSFTAREMLERSPEMVISQAVKRMLPKNPLGRRTFKKLRVYTGSEHPHEAQQPKEIKL